MFGLSEVPVVQLTAVEQGLGVVPNIPARVIMVLGMVIVRQTGETAVIYAGDGRIHVALGRRIRG